jgi:glutaredoxin
MDPIHVAGTDKGRVMLFALSTCGGCARTKDLLNDLGGAYDYVFVDRLPREEMERVYADMMKRYNPLGSFPTVVINGRVIVGFKEEDIREALI